MKTEVSSNWYFYAVLFAAAFGLNLVWEISQMSDFKEKPGESIGGKLFFCTFASVMDALTTITIVWLLFKLFQAIDWNFYLAAAFAGAVCAMFFEWAARIFDLWEYDGEMIVVPFIKTGLLPFVQLMVLVPLAIMISRLICFRQQRN